MNLHKIIGAIRTYFKGVLTKKKLIVALLIFVACSIFYHNDDSYIFFRDTINVRLKNRLDLDILETANSFARALDIVGSAKRLANPLNDSNFIDIRIEEDQWNKMKQGLLKSPRKKKWAKAQINISGEFQGAKIKFHGTNSAHYQNDKYSFTIKISKDSSFVNNVRRFKLIKGEEADPTLIAANKMAHSMGLISAYGKMTMLRVNGEEKGHYYFLEDIKKEMLEREYGITNYSIICNVADWSRKENIATGWAHTSDNDLYFPHIEMRKNMFYSSALGQYKILAEHIENGELEEVKKFFDLDYMARFLSVATVFNDLHFMAGDNLKLIYDFGRGKFYPIFRIESGGSPIIGGFSKTFPNFNKFLFHSNGDVVYEAVNFSVFKLLTQDNETRNIRDKYLFEMISQKSDFIQSLNQVYTYNDAVMLHSGISRRFYDVDLKKRQLHIINSTLDIGEKMIKYGHIYASFDSVARDLHLLVDAFSPINVSNMTSDFEQLNVNGIQLDNNLEPVNNHLVYRNLDEEFNPKDLVFINGITQDTLSKHHIYLNFVATSKRMGKNTTEQMLKDNNVSFHIKNDSIIINSGDYVINSDVVITPNFSLLVQPGATFKLANGVNFCVQGNITINGSKEKEVIIKNIDESGAFGSFVIIGQNKESFADINFLKVSGGSQSLYFGRLFTGQFAIYNSNVSLKNSTFEKSNGDDGLNIKYSKVQIDSCVFVNNLADQVDLDFCFATISNCKFVPSFIDRNGDGLDLSGSFANVTNCEFANFLDKALSLGEKSKVLVSACNFQQNENAIAIKDQTLLYSWNNEFISNRQDYHSFIKKKIFNAPKLFVNEDVGRLNMTVVSGYLHPFTNDDIEIQKNKFAVAYSNFTANNDLSNKLQLGDLIDQY